MTFVLIYVGAMLAVFCLPSIVEMLKPHKPKPRMTNVALRPYGTTAERQAESYVAWLERREAFRTKVGR